MSTVATIAPHVADVLVHRLLAVVEREAYPPLATVECEAYPPLSKVIAESTRPTPRRQT